MINLQNQSCQSKKHWVGKGVSMKEGKGEAMAFFW